MWEYIWRMAAQSTDTTVNFIQKSGANSPNVLMFSDSWFFFAEYKWGVVAKHDLQTTDLLAETKTQGPNLLFFISRQL
jgi:hypothetical protein